MNWVIAADDEYFFNILQYENTLSKIKKAIRSNLWSGKAERSFVRRIVPEYVVPRDKIVDRPLP